MLRGIVPSPYKATLPASYSQHVSDTFDRTGVSIYLLILCNLSLPNRASVWAAVNHTSIFILLGSNQSWCFDKSWGGRVAVKALKAREKGRDLRGGGRNGVFIIHENDAILCGRWREQRIAVRVVLWVLGWLARAVLGGAEEVVG